MKILIVFDIVRDADNPFVRLLAEGLRRQADCKVVCSGEEFWTNAENYDIVHLQWPEALFDWHWPDPEQLRKLEERFVELKAQGIRIVYTRHNTSPHKGNPLVMEGYRLVEQYADAVAHLGEFSRSEFLEEYPLSQQRHVVIPHHIYEGEYDTEVTRAQGRSTLQIPQQAFVILAFGAFRHSRERELVWSAFRRCRCKGKYLVAPRLFPYPYYSHWRTGLKSLMARLGFLAVRGITWFAPCRITSLRGLIPTEELPYYVAATDVVFIQRTDILNSGNVTLGFSFGKVVVGPDRGNIGEMLRCTGNPVFDPESPESVDRALADAARLAREGHGEKNRLYAAEHFATNRIASMYKALYEQLHAGK